MSCSKEQLQSWLNDLPEDAEIAIDDGGLSLIVPDTVYCYEVGGVPEKLPITISQLADFILGREATNGQDFADAGLPMMGGCEGCHATVACYNSCPSKTGNIRCTDCIGNFGFYTVEEAEAFVFPEREANILFPDVITRDFYLTTCWPERKCSEDPGIYECGPTVTIGVWDKSVHVEQRRTAG